MSEARAEAPTRVHLGRVARYGLLVGPVLSMVDSSIVNVAVPDVARDVAVGLSRVQWVVSGYLLALAVGLALTAYASRRWGTMRVYRVSMVAFVVASVACACAPSIELLIAARAVQGFVGAPLVPLALTILMGRDGVGGNGGRVPLSAALVLFLAPTLGPTLGGLLVGAGGWRWVFLVNVPVGAVGLLCLLHLPTLGARGQAETRFDATGTVLLASGLVCALLGATRGAGSGWGRTSVSVLLLAAAVLLASYRWAAAHQAQPALRLDVVRGRSSVLLVTLQVACSVIAFGTVFLVPVFTEHVQGHSALATGVALLPQSVVMGVGTVVGQRLAVKVPLRALVTVGFGLLAASSSVLLLLSATTPLWVCAVMLCGRAAAAGVITTPLLSAFLAPLPESELTEGNTLYTIAQRLGGSLGVAVLGSVAARGVGPVAALESFHLVGVLLVGLALVAAAASCRLPLTGSVAASAPPQTGRRQPELRA